jgi:hypothetical protein
MSRQNRSAISDPSFFSKITAGTGKTLSKEEDDELFFEKGKRNSGKLKFEGKDKIILVGEKGESDIHIDLGNARNIVRKLRDRHATDYINNLQGEVKEDFLSLHDLINVLHGTPAYKYIHDMIVSEFRCVEDNRYRIGTVGAFFCECQQPSDFPGNKSCSLGCLLGLKPKNTCKGYYPCQYTCLIYNGDGTFAILHRVTDVSQAYIFVNDQLSFRGLTFREVEKLEGLGISEVKIVKHSDGLSYQEVSSDFVPVRRLLVAGTSQKSNSNASIQSYGKSNGKSSLHIFVIILLFLLLLAAAYFIYIEYKDQGWLNGWFSGY